MSNKFVLDLGSLVPIQDTKMCGIPSLNKYKNLAIANRSRVSWAHNTSTAFIHRVSKKTVHFCFCQICVKFAL